MGFFILLQLSIANVIVLKENGQITIQKKTVITSKTEVMRFSSKKAAFHEAAAFYRRMYGYLGFFA